MTEIVKGSEKIVVFDLGKVLLDFDYMKAAGKLVPLCGVSSPRAGTRTAAPI